MKNFKIAFWLILIVLLILIFFQNKEFLMGKQALLLNIFVIDEMQSSPLPIAVWFLVALCIGFLVANFFARIEKFKTRRLIKMLKSQTDAQSEMITQMKNELEGRTGCAMDEGVGDLPPAGIGGQDLEKM